MTVVNRNTKVSGGVCSLKFCRNFGEAMRDSLDVFKQEWVINAP